MPRPTRQQRRARRLEQAASAGADGAVSKRARARQPAQVRQAPEPVAPAERRRRGGFVAFIVECWGELKKVDWPNQRQVMTGTVAVIIACTIVGAYLYAADLVLRPFVERIVGT